MPKPAHQPLSTSPSSPWIIRILVAVVVFVVAFASWAFALLVAIPTLGLVLASRAGTGSKVPPAVAARVAGWWKLPGFAVVAWILLATSASGGAFGVFQRATAAMARRDRCKTNRIDAHEAFDANNMAGMAAAVRLAGESCGPDEQVEIAALTQDLNAKRDAKQEQQVADRKAAVAQAAVDREAAAVAGFPAQATTVRAKLKDAKAAAGRGAWAEADSALYDAKGVLDALYGTSVAQSTEWNDLTKQIADQRKRIQPQLDRLAAAKASKQAAEARQQAAVAAQQSAAALGDLLDEYKDNEVRADAKYKGNTIEVTGLVGDVKKDILGSIYVTVGRGALFEFPVVQCFAASGQEAAAAGLSKGNKVTVRGRVSGLMMNVLVKDCSIVQ
jgi:hypothetical protein